MLIRKERSGDEEAIHDLTLVAFEPMTFSDGSEAPIIKSLRESGDLTLSLVAEENGKIIGHIAFSPVSVWPDEQRRGIGKALILRGLGMLRGRGACGCALIGNPEIYSRAGFKSDDQLSYRNLDRGYVQRIVFAGPAPCGELKFAPAFEGEGHTG